MTNVSKTIRDTENNLIKAINESNLPPAVIRLILTNILRDVTEFEMKEENQKTEEVSTDGND